MAYRYVLDQHTIEIRFQKPIIPEKENFKIFSHEKTWALENVSQSSDKRSIFIRTLEPMPFYESKQSNKVVSMRIENIRDVQGNKYYGKEPREMWIPWRNTV